jgi:zinc/manganese transport system substrate-binding protein
VNRNSIIGFGPIISLVRFTLGAVLAGTPGVCQAKEKLNVVTTTTNLKSLAEAVGGEHVSVFSIATGSEDPHFVEAKPSYMMKARNADLWIRIGLELEIGYEDLIISGSRNPRIRVGSPGHLDASEGIKPLEVPTGRVSRSMGDVHPLGNPHYWLDPYNGRIMARNICRRLKKLDAEHAADYDRNLAAFLLKLDSAMFGGKLVEAVGGEKLWKMQSDGSLDSSLKGQTLPLDGWLAKLKPFEHAKIVTYHRSWSYFAHRFHLEIVGELEPKPGIPPSPGHVLEVINTMKSDKVGILLMEPFYNRADADAVAQKTGARVIVAAAAVAGQEEATDYIAMLDNVVTRLSNALTEVAK